MTGNSAPLLLAWLAVLGCCGALTTDDGIATLTGRVVDRAGGPQQGAQIAVVRNRRPIATTVTDVEGRFSLEVPAGEAALFGLQNEHTDEGVWRPGLSLRPAGTTDLGELELEKVWAYPDVLWLRGVGYDEQLTTPEDGVQLLWAGSRDEPILTVKYLHDRLVVARVYDDGSTRTLVDAPWQEPASLRPTPGSAPPPVLRVWATRCSDGRVRVGLVDGAYTWFGAGGPVTSPLTRLRWLNVDDGSIDFDVQVPTGSTARWSETHGVLVTSAGQRTRWYDLASRRQIPVEVSPAARVVPTDGETVFLVESSPSGVTATRIDRDGVRRSEHVAWQRPTDGSPLVLGASGVRSLVVGVDGSLEPHLEIVRFDVENLTSRREVVNVAPSLRRGGHLPPCTPGHKLPTTLIEGRSTGGPLRALHVGDESTHVATGVLGENAATISLSRGCSSAAGFWTEASQHNGVSLLTALRPTPLNPDEVLVGQDRDVAVLWLGGGRYVLVDPFTGVRRDVARSPFVTQPTGFGDENTRIAYGAIGDGAYAFFRVRR